LKSKSFSSVAVNGGIKSSQISISITTIQLRCN